MADSENNPKKTAATFCGAKTRSGGTCKRRPVHGKHRCRLHGGLSTGAPKGNQNAVKTGERAKVSLFRDLFGEEDRALWDQIEIEKRAQLEEEIRLLTMRERFMLQRIHDLQAKGEFSLYERTAETHVDTDEQRDRDGQTVGAARISTSNKTAETRRATLERVQAIEDALTRVQNSKAKAIELLIKLEAELSPGSGDTVKQFLAALDGKAAEVWAEEPNPDEAEAMEQEVQP